MHIKKISTLKNSRIEIELKNGPILELALKKAIMKHTYIFMRLLCMQAKKLPFYLKIEYNKRNFAIFAKYSKGRKNYGAIIGVEVKF